MGFHWAKVTINLSTTPPDLKYLKGDHYSRFGVWQVASLKLQCTHCCNTPSQRTIDSTAYTEGQPCNLRPHLILICRMYFYPFWLVLSSIHTYDLIDVPCKYVTFISRLPDCQTAKHFPDGEPFKTASCSTVFGTRSTCLDPKSRQLVTTSVFVSSPPRKT